MVLALAGDETAELKANEVNAQTTHVNDVMKSGRPENRRFFTAPLCPFSFNVVAVVDDESCDDVGPHNGAVLDLRTAPRARVTGALSRTR